MNPLTNDNTNLLIPSRSVIVALLFALTLGAWTTASARSKSGPRDRSRLAPVEVCTIQVDLADVVDTNAPDGEAPLSYAVSTQTQLWAENWSPSSEFLSIGSQSQSTMKLVAADVHGLIAPDAVDTLVASYTLEEGTAEVVQICSRLSVDGSDAHASELHCEDRVISCDMAGEAVASEVALCLDAGAPSADLCAHDMTAVVRFTYTFVNPDLTVDSPLDTLTPTLELDPAGKSCSACNEKCQNDGKGDAIIHGSFFGQPTQEPCRDATGRSGFKTCVGTYMSYSCELDSSPRREYQGEADCGECIAESSGASGIPEDESDLLD